MKHKLIILLCVAAVVLLGVVTVREYRHYQRDERAKVLAAQQLAAQEQAANKATQDQLVQSFNTLYDQCKLGETAYGLLSTSLQAKNVAPNCGKALVQ